MYAKSYKILMKGIKYLRFKNLDRQIGFTGWNAQIANMSISP